MNHAEALALLERAEPVCSAADARLAVERLAAEITSRLGSEFPMVLAIMGGAVVFTGQLLPLLAFPLEFRAIEVTRYADTMAGGDIEWRLAPREDVRGRTVLVLDDILDEGVTLAAVRAHCEMQGAASVRLAVLCEKRHGRCLPGLKADYVGVEVPDRYVFGFGMDYYEQGRNLPAIYAI